MNEWISIIDGQKKTYDKHEALSELSKRTNNLRNVIYKRKIHAKIQVIVAGIWLEEHEPSM